MCVCGGGGGGGVVGFTRDENAFLNSKFEEYQKQLGHIHTQHLQHYPSPHNFELTFLQMSSVTPTGTIDSYL